MKDLGNLKYFLGIEFARSKEGINMHKRKYALEFISKDGLSAAKHTSTPIDTTPIDTNIKLTSTINDKVICTKSQVEKDLLVDQATYQRLIGKLLYLTVTRHDISFGVQTLSQFLQQHKQSHMTATLRIVRYIKNQPGRGILLSSKTSNVVTAYCDVDWAACPITRRSVTCFLIKIGDSLGSWKSKKQITFSRSSAEVELEVLQQL
uniref:Uncharacterized mitochondrial protein AtMg00810-like n=1 Tax=Nicotiana tabacum TaxID=4097 RepID=A0A1S3ZW86_TOBAC|nr:PREDICTED: uncharacterized mitochondrial protein AtMg00810-like [Nicotiana tabacum]